MRLASEAQGPVGERPDEGRTLPTVEWRDGLPIVATLREDDIDAVLRECDATTDKTCFCDGAKICTLHLLGAAVRQIRSQRDKFREALAAVGENLRRPGQMMPGTDASPQSYIANILGGSPLPSPRTKY